jgi:hypothetical protein
MTHSTDNATNQALSLPEELILMLLNEENGYFYQVPGWTLNCVVVGAVLAELSLLSRIDTDLETLFLIDGSETGDPRAGRYPEGDSGRTGAAERPVLDRTPRPARGVHY